MESLPFVLSISVMETFPRNTVTFTFEMLKQMFLYTCIIPYIFLITVFVIVSSKTEFIGDFAYILFNTALICEKTNHKIMLQLSLCFTFKLSPVIVLVNLSASSIFKRISQLDFLEPTFLSKGYRVALTN